VEEAIKKGISVGELMIREYPDKIDDAAERFINAVA